MTTSAIQRFTAWLGILALPTACGAAPALPVVDDGPVEADWTSEGLSLVGATEIIECPAEGCCSVPTGEIAHTDTELRRLLRTTLPDVDLPPEAKAATGAILVLYLPRCGDTGTTLDLVDLRAEDGTVVSRVAILDRERGFDALSRPYVLAGLPGRDALDLHVELAP